MSDLPLPQLFGPLKWVFAVLLVVNGALFAAIVIEREQWIVHQRLRERVRKRLAPVIERLLEGEDAERAAAELRPVIRGLGVNARPVAAWLVLDALSDVDSATRSVICRALEECGAVEIAERSTRRWMPWRRALACEFLGTIGTGSSVDVLVARLRDRRAEVRVAAARALGVLGDAAAAGPLTEVFLRHRGVPIGVVNDALSRLGPAALDAYRLGIESPEPTVRVTSCFGVAAQANVEVASETLALLERRLRTDGELQVRSAAAGAMRWLPGDAAPGSLLDGLYDSAPAVRRSAAWALAGFDDPAAVRALAGAVADADRETALRSAESLLALADGVRAGAPARRALAASRAWAVDSVCAVAELAA